MSNSEQTFTDSKSIPSPVTSFPGFCGEFPIVYPMVSKWTRVAPIYLVRIMLMTLTNVMFVFDTGRRKKILPVIGGKTDWEIGRWWNGMMLRGTECKEMNPTLFKGFAHTGEIRYSNVNYYM